MRAEGDVTVRTQRYDDTLTINTKVQCDFDCMETMIANSEKCNGNGNFACGVCLCFGNYFGKSCEFTRPDCPTPGSNCNDCINPVQPTEICSGNGTCPNDFCTCHIIPDGQISGKWCQCSTQDCFNDGSDGTQRGICSMHGNCECDPENGHGISTCVCEPGWTGDKCRCPSSQNSCLAGGEICSGRGACECGKCKCHEPERWTGVHCDIPNCAGNKCASCTAYLDCVKCRNHGEEVTGDQTCKELCNDGTANYIDVEKGTLLGDSDRDNGKLCSGLACPKDDPECTSKCKFYYKYSDLSDGKVKVWAEKDAHCRVQYSFSVQNCRASWLVLNQS